MSNRIAQSRLRPEPPGTGRIRILIVDDHEVVRCGLRQLLERETDMEIIGEASTGLDAVRIAEGKRPDVVLLDTKLGDIDGPDVCRRILTVSPATSVVMLTGYLREGVVLQSLAAGAKGYLIKDVELPEVKRTIRAVYRGHSVLDPKVASVVIANATAGNGKSLRRLSRVRAGNEPASIPPGSPGPPAHRLGASAATSSSTMSSQ